MPSRQHVCVNCFNSLWHWAYKPIVYNWKEFILMVLMEAEHEVWIIIGVRSSIFLPGVFLNLTGNAYAHEKEVLMWYIRQSLDKSHVVQPVSELWSFSKARSLFPHIEENRCDWLQAAHLENLFLPPAASARCVWHLASSLAWSSSLGQLPFLQDSWEAVAPLLPKSFITCAPNTKERCIWTVRWQCAVGENARSQQAGEVS